MKDNETILIVGESPERTKIWAGWLERAGYATLACAGPTLTPCPRLGASRCALREIVDAAVVEVQGPAEPHPYGEWHEHACTRLPDDGTTIFVSQESSLGLQHPVDPMGLIAAVEAVLGHPAPMPAEVWLG